MFFWNKFCGLLLLFFIFINFSYAQSEKQKITTAKNNYVNNTFSFSKIMENPGSTIYFTPSVVPKNKYVFHQKSANLPLENSHALPGNFATCNFGFFCRQELKIEKATNIPIRIRLGSLAQCNYYEGKP